MSKTTRRRARRKTFRWYAPLAEDAPEGIDETDQHPHFEILQGNVRLLMKLEEVRAGAVSGDVSTKDLVDEMWTAIKGAGGDWSLYVDRMGKDPGDVYGRIQMLTAGDLGDLVGHICYGQQPSEDEKKS